ncbi:unnamed protein product [Bathycoccus prasinos]
MAPGNVANRLLGFISTNLKKTKRQSKRLSSRFVVGKDDDFEKENLNLSRSKSLSPKERETKTTEKKRARDDASMVREMREYLTKRVKEEDGGKRDEKGYVEYLEYFEAAENVVRENERLRELLAKKNGGTETDDEDVPESGTNASEEERERDDVKASTEGKKKEEVSQPPSSLWNVVVHSDDVFKAHILPKLTEMDVSHLYNVNSESSALIARCGLLWSVLVNKDDIWNAHIFPKLNGTDMKFLYQTNPETRALIKRSDVHLQNKFKAIEMSSISTLQWSWERNVRKNTGENVWWYHSTSFCHKLAQTNKLELLKWAREEKNCDIWDAKTTVAAIKQGNVEMLKYCLENDCPTSSIVCERAAEDGQLECLKYLHEVAGVEWEGQKKGGSLAAAAAKNGHLHILKYLVEKDYDIPRPRACDEAAENGHLECLKYLREVAKAPWDKKTVLGAAENAHLHILKYLVEGRYPYFQASACARTAECGHLECLKYLHEVAKLPWDHETGESAASGGHLHILKYLAERKYSCWLSWGHDRACTLAARAGHLECLKFLREVMKMPWGKQAGVSAVIGENHNILEYLYKSKYPHFTAEMCTQAAKQDDVPALKYLRDVCKAPWDEETGNLAACSRDWEYEKKYDAFNYLVQSKFPYFTANACLNACKVDNLECLKYLLETLKVPIHRDCVREARYAGYPSHCYHYLKGKGYREPEV